MPASRARPGQSAFEDLRYLAQVTVGAAQRERCTHLAYLLTARLGLRRDLAPGKRADLIRHALSDVVRFERSRAVAAGAGSIARGAVIDVSGHDPGPFLVAAAGELLGLGDDDSLTRVRRTLGVNDRTWAELIGKEEREGASRVRSLRAGLWLGELAEQNYSSRRARSSTAKILDRLLTALDSRLNDTAFQEALVTGVLGAGRPPSRTEPANAPDGYIRRSSYHSRFDRLLRTGSTCVVLTGLPGIGKTRLAEALVADHLPPGTAACVLRLNGGRINPQDMIAALATAGRHHPPDRIYQQPEAFLVDLLRGDHAPPFVLIDNLDSFHELDRLLPHDITSTVVVTCRVSGRARRPHDVIPVDRMEPHETVALIQDRLPGRSAEDAGKLVSLLHGYPILIEHACALLQHGYPDLPTFAADLATDRAALARGVTTEENRTLGVVVHRLLTHARAEHDLLDALLTCLAFTDTGSGVDDTFAIGFLRADLGRDVSRTEFAAALAVAHRYSLVRAWTETAYLPDGSDDAAAELRRLVESAIPAGAPIRVETTTMTRLPMSRTIVTMHAAVRDLVVDQLRIADARATRSAAVVVEQAMAELAEVGRRHTIVDGEQLDPPTPPPATGPPSAARHYETYGWARIHARMLPFQSDLAHAVGVSRAHDDLHIGVVAIVFDLPELPLRVFDLTAAARPASGPAVRLLGHEFTLVPPTSPLGGNPRRLAETLAETVDQVLVARKPLLGTGRATFTPTGGMVMVIADEYLLHAFRPA